jgi:hypothetical protein
LARYRQPKKNFRINGFTKTVTLHLLSIGPNVQQHMAYFAVHREGRVFRRAELVTNVHVAVGDAERFWAP